MSEEADILVLAQQRVGTILNGKYHVDGVLGVGGMATVYAATHRNRKRFAVKMLHPEFSIRKDVRARFIREGYVANSVDHPGVVAVLDDDVDETGAAFLVMELLEGVTVDSLYAASGAPLGVREALGIAYQLLEVLEAAHAKSIVHRDIKPANLFISRAGELKVLDFGIARLRDAEGGLKSTRTGAMLGTPAFMSPEQAMATPGDIDGRTDLWAVGATLFTLLSARFVHEGENARQIMIRAATVPARSLDSIMPELPAAVVELVARALKFDCSERWPSATDMKQALIAAYRELFDASPERTELRALVARTAASIGTSPTEPHRFTPSGERESEQRPGEPAPAPLTAVVPTALVPRAEQTTSSTPVSSRGETSLPWKGKPWAVVAVSTAAALAGGVIWRSLSRSGTEPQLTTTVPAVAPLVTNTSPTKPADAAPRPVPSSASISSSQGAEPTLPAASSASGDARKLPPSGPTSRTKTTRAASSAVSAPAAPPSAPAPAHAPDNPLKLELQ